LPADADTGKIEQVAKDDQAATSPVRPATFPHEIQKSRKRLVVSEELQGIAGSGVWVEASAKVEVADDDRHLPGVLLLEINWFGGATLKGHVRSR
jgi:hypothetical protein